MFESDYTVLVGTYSDMDALAHQPHAPKAGTGIHTLKLGADGQLSETSVAPTLNPAVLIPHPDGKHLYAILETIKDHGTVERYEVQAGGELSRKDTLTANGYSTCYLSLAPRKDAAIIINYWDAIIDVCRVDEEGKLGNIHQSFKQYHRPKDQWRQVTTREDHWGNRQVGPHAHCAHFWHDWVFIPDLGENAVFQYRYDEDSATLTPDGHIPFEAGSGPRHMVMHPTLDVCYISNELFNTVCVADLIAADPQESQERLVPRQYLSTLQNRDQESYVSEIKLSPDARFLYISNRGDDSLAVYKVLDDGSLEWVQRVPTGGRFPRHFAITPCGKGVLAANQDSGTITRFARDIQTGTLTDLGDPVSIGAPCYLRFVAT